jgi:hypothetical protein
MRLKVELLTTAWKRADGGVLTVVPRYLLFSSSSSVYRCSLAPYNHNVLHILSLLFQLGDFLCGFYIWITLIGIVGPDTTFFPASQ